MDDTLDIEPEHAIKLAKEYLAGNWLKSSAKTVSLNILSGGYCSRLYICADLTGKCEPSKFLIRLNGGKILEGNEGVKYHNEGTESLVFFMHGHLGYGPKLYGSFKGGRLEEFIPSRTLKDKDLENENIRMQFARKLARFHSMKLPVSKKPHPSFDYLREAYKIFDTQEGRQTFLRNAKLASVDPSWIETIDIPAEIDWVHETLQKVGGRLVLSTNDMNRLNCLIRDTPDKFGEMVTLVDYEVGGTNWRGYDVGTHFVMWTVDPDKPDLRSGIPFPGVGLRRQFIEEYLRETKSLGVYDDFDDDGLDSTDHVLMEADLMSMVIALFIVPFLLKPPHESNTILSKPAEIFKFHSFSRSLVQYYVRQKDYFLREYDEILHSKTPIVGDDINILYNT